MGQGTSIIEIQTPLCSGPKIDDERNCKEPCVCAMDGSMIVRSYVRSSLFEVLDPSTPVALAV